MGKSNKKWWIVGVVLILFIITGYFGYLDKWIGLKFGTPKSCFDEPHKANCYCPEGYMKTGGIWDSWTCSELEFDGTAFPIETMVEAYTYVEEVIGISCPQEEGYYIFPDLTYQMPQCTSGYYGFGGYSIEVECKKYLDETKTAILWSIDFDPNDGWINQFFCAYNEFNCPEEMENLWNPKPSDLRPECSSYINY